MPSSQPTTVLRIKSNQRSDYLLAIQEWNVRISEAQRPIRLLEAIRWNEQVEEDFFTRGCKELPRVTIDEYRQRPLSFDPHVKSDELRRIERDILRQLGSDDPAARLLLRRARHCRDAIRLIGSRGTREFTHLSRAVFGSGFSEPGLRKRLVRLIEQFQNDIPTPEDQPRHSATDTARVLASRFRQTFGDDAIRVVLTDEISSDACAGRDYLKLRRDASFTENEVGLLEVHEGWVHLATSRNGGEQPIFPVLGKVCCGVIAAQEGLAILTEMLAGVFDHARRRKLALRFRAVMMAEEGADFLQVFGYLHSQIRDAREAYRQTARVFRGSLPSGIGPFTKDLGYGLGLLEVTALLRRALSAENFDVPALLFCGKINIEDWPDVAALHRQGLLAGGSLIPPPFRDPLRLRESLKRLAIP